MILRGELDLAGGFVRPLLGLLCGLGLLLFLLVVLVPSIEADRRLQNQENVVAGPLDLAYRLRDAVRLGKGIVDRVSQFLHEVLQWLFHRVLPYLVMRRCDTTFHIGGFFHPFRL